IMRQVRASLATARAAGTAGPLLEFAFSAALRTAKRARREVTLAPVNVSLFRLALPRLRGLLLPGARVAMIGAGEMASLVAHGLRRERGDLDLCIVNRDEVRGRALAERVSGRWSPLAGFLEAPTPQHMLVTATPRGGLIDRALV